MNMQNSLKQRKKEAKDDPETIRAVSVVSKGGVNSTDHMTPPKDVGAKTPAQQSWAALLLTLRFSEMQLPEATSI